MTLSNDLSLNTLCIKVYLHLKMVDHLYSLIKQTTCKTNKI